jgi:hypothetical protein
VLKKAKAVNEVAQTAVADFIVEEYRFIKSYMSAVNKLFPEERQKYYSAFNFHMDKINEIAERVGVGINDFEGKDYDDGLPITPLNMDEFTKEDELIIGQTIEPTVVNSLNGSVIRQGSVILVKKPELPKVEETPPQQEAVVASASKQQEKIKQEIQPEKKGENK